MERMIVLEKIKKVLLLIVIIAVVVIIIFDAGHYAEKTSGAGDIWWTEINGLISR